VFGNFSLFKIPFPGWNSVPPSFASFLDSNSGSVFPRFFFFFLLLSWRTHHHFLNPELHDRNEKPCQDSVMEKGKFRSPDLHTSSAFNQLCGSLSGSLLSVICMVCKNPPKGGAKMAEE